MNWFKFVLDPSLPSDRVVQGRIWVSPNGVDQWEEWWRFESVCDTRRLGTVRIWDFSIIPDSAAIFGARWGCTCAGSTLKDALCTGGVFIESFSGIKRIHQWIQGGQVGSN